MIIARLPVLYPVAYPDFPFPSTDPTKMAMVWRTRSKTAVYLLGTVEEGIHSAKLPSIRQALGFFMHLHSFCGLKYSP